jgi:cell division transport system ATP-binding protein
LKSLYAEMPIVDGSARIFDYDLRTMRRSQIPYLRRRLGIIFQDFQLLVDRTVQQNLEFVLRATGWTDLHSMDERIEEVLKLIGMENKGYRMPNTLSGGEQQRVVIARALLNEPTMILADEPTGNLDPETGNNIVQLLYDICHTRHTAVLMSTHNLQLLEQFPGRVLRVEDGKVTEEVMANAAAADDIAGSNEPLAAEETSSETSSEKESESGEVVVVDETISETEPEDDATRISEPEEEAQTAATLFFEPEIEVTAAEVTSEDSAMAQSVANEEVVEEIQSNSAPDSADSSSVEDHCSQSEIQPEEQNRSGQSDQKPVASAAPTEPYTPQSQPADPLG